MKKTLNILLLISLIIFLKVSYCCTNNKFNPYCTVKEITSRIIPEMNKKRDIRSNHFFIVNIVEIDTIKKRIEFSVDFILMDFEFDKVNPKSFFEYDSTIVLIKSNLTNLITSYNFPKLDEYRANNVRKKLFDTSDRFSFISYDGLTVVVNYENEKEKLTYFNDEYEVPIKYRKYDYGTEKNNSNLKIYKTEEVIRLNEINKLNNQKENH